MFSNNMILVYNFKRLIYFTFPSSPQQVTDRTCLRALEKIKIQLGKGSKESDQAVVAQDVNMTTNVLQNEDGNCILT